MSQARSQVRLGLVAAAVLALHGAAVWMLLTRSLVLHVHRLSENLLLVFLPPPVPQRPQPPPQAPQPERRPRQPAATSQPKPESVPPDIAAPAPEPDNSISPPVDWGAELTRQAHDSVAAQANQHFREFDFPRPPPAPAKSPEFGWSRARIHRIERQPGALIVHLNDHCVLVFFPLPFTFCKVGHIPANDQLFEHMKDASSANEATAP